MFSKTDTIGPAAEAVVGHVQLEGLRESGGAQIYLPYRNYPLNVIMTIRTAAEPDKLASSLRKLIEGLGGKRPIYDIRLMTDYLGDGLAETRFAMVLFGVMSGVALLLSVIGIYGVVSYSVAQRMQEFAIRIALGAQPRDILKLALGFGVGPAVAGLVIGVGGALLLTRSMQSLLFGVTATDPVTFGTVSIVLLGAAILACYMPLRWRALRTDPRSFLG